MKVHVVGAGPAGSISAITALRNGHEVIVSEDHPKSGTPENCSGLFSQAGLETLASYVNYKPFIVNPINGADIYFVDQKISIRRSSPVGYVCSRHSLDESLAQKASEEGAKINYGERITDRFHADNIIGADGPLSSVARYFGFKKINKHASTLQSIVRYSCEDSHAVEVYLSNEKFPGFFAWIIPHDEYTAEFGVGVELPHRAINAWNALLKLKGVSTNGFNNSSDKINPKGAVIPLSVRSRTGKQIKNNKNVRNVILVGDAAGQVKATTGGGVIFGGNCAKLAGKHFNNPLRYEVEWRARYGADLAIHSKVHNYVAGLSDSQLSAFGKRLNKMNLGEFLSKNGHMDRPTKMIRPSLLLHLLKNGPMGLF
ncbi:NAD(P)/FAD-dependent oxidoreductase [Candidatus Micrarchaeota archaeon]|nr:NAD(P)/FAD-dependent oxidoreductase [Candidatus Micrarchaeota archaeon]